MTKRHRGHRTVLLTAALTLATGLTAPAALADSAPRSGAASTAAADVDYATWQRDVQAAVDPALTYLEDRLAQGGGRPAIVLDIDNTSLESHFHPLPPTPAVAPVRDLATYVHEHGGAVFFVTARPDLIDWATRPNLESEGYQVDGLYARSLGDVFGDPAEFKTAKRAEIEGDGYTIVANIGNNTTDLTGGHAERTFKLPDYDGALS